MELTEFLVDDAFILVPVLLVIGAIIKRTELVADKLIPVAILALGLLGANALLGPGVEQTIQGVLVAGVAVFGNQIVKQIQKDK